MQQEPRLPPAVAPLAPKALQAHRRRVHAVQRSERGRHRSIGGRALPLAELWARSVGVYAPLRGGADASALRCCETERIELFPTGVLEALSSIDPCKHCTESGTALTSGLRGASARTHCNRHLLSPPVHKGSFARRS